MSSKPGTALSFWFPSHLCIASNPSLSLLAGHRMGYDEHPWIDRPIYSSSVQALESKRQCEADSAGRSIQEPQSLAVSFRHSGWQPDRKRVAESLARTEQCDSRRTAFCDCGNFAYVLQNADDPSQYRLAGSSCHDRFCVPCATERSGVMAANANRIVQGKEVRFLTLTLRSEHEPLGALLDKLYASFQALRRRNIWKDHVVGGVAFLEIKWFAEKERWHPHVHCLIEGTWIDQKEISKAWHEITGDSFVVDIRRPGNMDSIARYVAKYASKPLHKSFARIADRLDEAVLAMRGRKLAITYGSWRGELLTQTETEGVWIQIGSLDAMIARAAHGSIEAIAVMQALTDRDLSELYGRAPPTIPQGVVRIGPDVQSTFFGAWLANGTYRYSYD